VDESEVRYLRLHHLNLLCYLRLVVMLALLLLMEPDCNCEVPEQAHRFCEKLEHHFLDKLAHYFYLVLEQYNLCYFRLVWLVLPLAVLVGQPHGNFFPDQHFLGMIHKSVVLYFCTDLEQHKPVDHHD
jgi:hypothetical protein